MPSFPFFPPDRPPSRRLEHSSANQRHLSAFMIEQGSGIHRLPGRFGGVAKKTIEMVFDREAASGAYEPKPDVVEDTETNHALQTTSVTPGIRGKSSVFDRLLLGV